MAERPRVIRKIMHKIAFLGHRIEATGAISAFSECFNAKKNAVAEFHRENGTFRLTRKS